MCCSVLQYGVLRCNALLASINADLLGSYICVKVFVIRAGMHIRNLNTDQQCVFILRQCMCLNTCIYT